MEYSIVIPAYNEADKITASLTQILNFMRDFSKHFEVIVVDDGSNDDTATLVEEYKRFNSEVNLIKNPHRGKGAAVWAGFMQAQGDLIYMCDADLATPISTLKKLCVWIKDNNYDVVIASREGTGALRVQEPAIRHLIGRTFNLWVRLFALPGIQDSQCGFKLFTKTCAKDVFSRLTLYGKDAPEVKGALFGAFDVEVLYLARKLNYRIKELPVVWNYVKTDRLNFFQNSRKMALDVLKVRINDLKGVYSHPITA